MSNGLVQYRVGGRTYPMKSVRHCKVCQSPSRLEIEEGLITGRSYRRIVESLPEDANITIENVGDHYRRGHLPADFTMQRHVVEKRAESLGKSVERAAETLVDGITLAETVVQKTFEGIARGDLSPSVREGIRAAQLLELVGMYDQGGVDQQAYVQAYTVYHEVAQRVMSEEQFEEFGRLLEQNPVLKALAAKYEGETVQGEAEETQPALSGSLDNGDDVG